MEVHPASKNADYGQSQLLEAVDVFAKAPTSPAGYQQLRERAAALQPEFNESVRQLAERHLVFLAYPVLQAHAADPHKQQFDKLATTVWPTALGVLPRQGELAQAFATRVCAAELTSLCKSIVPEYWPLFWNAEVWRTLKQRAREAYVACNWCRNDPGFRRVLDGYDKQELVLSTLVGRYRSIARVSAWPVAGRRAASWSEPVAFRILPNGNAMFAGKEIPPTQWSSALQALRGEDMLGIHVHPHVSVAGLRSFLAHAKQVGIQTVALLARSKTYPHSLKAYHLSVSKMRGRIRVDVRDTDTVQVLVHVMDSKLAEKSSGSTLAI